MRTTLLRWLAIGFVTLVATAVATAGTALGTRAGREVLINAALAFGQDALRGSIAVGSIDGSIYRGLDARGIRLLDETGTAVIEIARLQVRYRVRDFLSRRIVLGQLTLTEPRISLVRRSDGRLNVEYVLKLGEGEANATPRPLVAFNDVRLTGGIVSYRAETDSLPAREIAQIAAADANYIRLSSPAASGMHFDLRALRARLASPTFDIRGARGGVTIDGDSLMLDLDDARLAETRTTVRGSVSELGAGGRFALDLEMRAFNTGELRELLPWLPAGVTGRGRVAVSPDGESVTVRASEIELQAPDGGQLRGTLGFVVGPGDAWGARGLDVTTTRFDIAMLEGILGEMPVDGLISGRTRANGSSADVQATIDWEFRDQRVGATTRIGGSGVVAFGVPGDIVFHGFRIEGADLALATLRDLVPAIALRGRLGASGTLDGPWQNWAFIGETRHRDGTLPQTVTRGMIRVDSRTDPVGVWADLTVDSLQFDGLRPSYPAAPLVGAFAGRVAVDGYLDSLGVAAELRGPHGTLVGGGIAVLTPSQRGMRNLDARFDSLRLIPADSLAPRSRFSGRARGSFVLDTLSGPAIDVEVGFGITTLAGVAFDSALVAVHRAETMLVVDTLRAWGPGLTVDGGGGLTFAAPRQGAIVINITVDSARAVAPLGLFAAGMTPVLAREDTVGGSGSAVIEIVGALDDYVIRGRVEGTDIRWHEYFLPSMRASGEWFRGGTGMTLDVEAESLAVARLGFEGLEGRLRGSIEHATWFARASAGRDAAFLAGGTIERIPGAVTVQFDSAALLLAANIWFLERGAAVTLDDSAVTLDRIAWRTATGRSQIEFGGIVPRRGPGTLRGSIGGLQVEDVRAFLQLPLGVVSGEMSGTLTLGGTARAPVIDAALQVRNGVVDEFRAPLTNARVHYAERQLEGLMQLVRIGEEILTVEVKLPVDLALREAIRRELPGPIMVRARADGVDLGLLNAVNPQVRNMGGRFWADLGITGSWDRPQLTGTLTVRDGAATFPGIGVRHERLNGALTFAGDTVRVDSLSTWSGGGMATVTGFIQLEGLTRPVLGLDLRAQRFFALALPDFLTMTVSGDVQLRGPVFGAALTGRGTITQGVVHFADIVEKDILSLEDTAFGFDSATAALIKGQGLGTAFQNRFLDSLRVDSLALTMGSDVRLRSTEADIQLTGDVTVGKRGRQYRIDGTLQTPRGTYRLPLLPTIVKDFTVTQGVVRYFGTPDLNAALDIDARHQLRDVRGDPVVVFVHVGGTIFVPTLTLSSDLQPPLSETEIISYLVFGAPSAQAAGGRVGQYGLQQSASSIAARVTGQFGGALIADLGVPLDYFEIRPEFGGQGVGFAGAEIALGRQIGERWFLSLNPRICPNETFTFGNVGGTLDFRMSRSWRLSASAEPLLSCFTSVGQPSRYQVGMDLLWERRY